MGLLKGKFEIDVFWSMIGLALMGLSGILLNIFVGLYYDASTLGVLNQIFAVYIFFSQFAAGGIQLSCVKFIPELNYQAKLKESATSILSALFLVLVFGLLFSSFFYLCRDWVGSFLQSPGVGEGMAWAALGLFFFAINKVLLGVLNSLKRMRFFALGQVLRALGILVSFFVLAAISWPANQLALVFTISETLLFFVLLIGVTPHMLAPEWGLFGFWLKKHFDFGLKSFMSGVLFELNTRVDVLMLGYFSSDVVVGVYSFAAMLVEGVFQIPLVLRNIYNPYLVELISSKAWERLKAMIRKGRNQTFGVMLALAIVSVGVYPFALEFVTNKAEFAASWPLFAILMLGLFLSSGYIPFGALILQAGRPGLHTMMITALVLFNALGNFVLIPFWGAKGAAVATSLSFVFSVLLLKLISQRALALKI